MNKTTYGLLASGSQCVVEFVNVKEKKLHVILDSADVDVVELTEAQR